MPPQSPTRSRFRITQAFSWRTFILGLAVTAAVFALLIEYPAAWLFLELKISDLRMNARAARPLSHKVVIVALDDKSIAAIGHWPWPRDEMAKFENALASYRPKVIGYDLLFSESDADAAARRQISARMHAAGVADEQIKASLGADNDQLFADAIRAQGSTILGYAFGGHHAAGVSAPIEAGYLTEVMDPPPMAYSLVHQAAGATPGILSADSYLPPIPILNRAASGTAYFDVDGDADGEFRTELTAIKFHGRYCVPFFLAVARAVEDNATLELNLAPAGVQSVMLGATSIPVDEMGRMMVTFHGSAASFPHYSAVDVIEHRIPPDALAGKAVLIGATAKAIGDRAVTPAGPEFPRVEIHANAIENVLTGDFIDRSRDSTVVPERLAALALGIAASFAISYLSASIAFAAVLVMAAGFVLYAQFLLFREGILIEIVLPLGVTIATAGALAIYRYWTEGREKRRLRHAFEHYLHPNVIASVVDNPGGLKLGGDRRVMTILFADIVNYTGLSERTDPAALVALLNEYMTRMTDLILESGGVVDKIRGDGIMAFWNAPMPHPNHARAAIDSALAMLSELAKLRQQDPRFATVDIGVGIATGEAIAGNFGGARRFDYSVIGDTVNLASRLEGLTRQFKVHLLVSKTTFVDAAGAYVARDIGLVKVKGKTNPVPVMEVVARVGESGVAAAFYDQFAAAVAELRSGAGDRARALLEGMRAQYPSDGVVGMYLEKLAGGAPATELVFEFDTK